MNSKTPIMILQERCVKKNSMMPIYDLIDSGSRTHKNVFKYRVRCDDLVAEGSGPNKKEAKQNAASEMLVLLNENVERVSTNKSMTTELQDNIMPGSSNNSTGDEQSPVDFCNAVGKLQEHCMQNRLKSPVYDTVNVSGPPHLTTFTLACSISVLRVEASASTKKQAKHNAAKKMLQHLGIAIESCIPVVGNIIESQNAVEIARKGIETLNLKIEEPSYSDNVIEKYKRITNLPILQKPSTGVANYHLYLKTLYVAEQQKLLLDKVENVYRNVRSTGGLREWKAALRIISLAFDFKFECFTFYTIEQSAKKMIGYTLHTTPLIIEIGCGDNLVEAEIEAIRKIMATLQILLM